MGPDGVVPLAVEGVGIPAHRGDLGVGDLPAHRIAAPIQSTGDRQALCGGGRGDQPDDRFIVPLWFAKIERDCIARGIFTSTADLRRKLMQYIRPSASGRQLAGPRSLGLVPRRRGAYHRIR